MVTDKPRPRAKEKACDQAIKETLSYSAIFNYPLSKFQLYTYLMTNRKFSVDFFDKSLRRLVKKGHIKAKDGKYYLPGVRPVSWNLRDKYSRELLEENATALKLLEKIPWIKMLAITGSVATNSAGKDDDVDVFIITQKDRVWITRAFLFLILKTVGKFGNTSENDRKLCCNLFVDESKMKWPEENRNTYIAHEIIRMHPVIDRNNTYFKFLKANDWIYDHFRNHRVTLPERFKRSPKGSLIVNSLEEVARQLQLSYMKKKKTTEVTTKKMIHFNKNDHMQSILDDFEEFKNKLL